MNEKTEKSLVYVRPIGTAESTDVFYGIRHECHDTEGHSRVRTY